MTPQDSQERSTPSAPPRAAATPRQTRENPCQPPRVAGEGQGRLNPASLSLAALCAVAAWTAAENARGGALCRPGQPELSHTGEGVRRRLGTLGLRSLLRMAGLVP